MATKQTSRSRTLKRLDMLEKEQLNMAGCIREQRLRVLQRQLIRCKHCGKRSRLGRWSFIQTHWYEAPYSCAGGDMWHRDETNLCHIVCPVCGEWNYIYNHPQRTLVVKTLDGYRLSPSNIFARVYEHHKNEWPIKQVHPRV